MTSLRSKYLLMAALFGLVLLAFPAFHASAQQISYYTFDAPGTNPSQYSSNCTESAPLFCLNNPTYSNASPPDFIQDPNIPDPNFMGGQWVLQMTNAAGGEAASMWFSTQQDVYDGFNAWFQFKISPAPPCNPPTVTTNCGSGNTGDGLAFVIQNSSGNGSVTIPGPNPENLPTPPSITCAESGSGWTAVGGGGGCMGYGGIDNSIALEFDTYNDNWDPTDIPGSANDNHIALQSCGTSGQYSSSGPPNSPVHYTSSYGDTSCLVTLATTPTPTSTLISNPTTSTLILNPGTPVTGSSQPVTLADGHTHQVVMVYNGPADNPPNQLSVYLDPAFNSGTKTPVANSVPLFQGPFDITQYIGLFDDEGSPSGWFPAYVGFTSATGAAFEQHEITGWTFTTHGQIQQSQPVNAPTGTSPATTTFFFGTHSYSVTYPPNTVVASGTIMTVIATPIPEATFAALIGPPFTGAQCQEYDDTGVTNGTNNCIAYNVSCTDSSYTPIACPAAPGGASLDCAANPTSTDCITLTTSYNNSIQPTSPGFLQGDPFYAPIQSINIFNQTQVVDTSGTIQCSGGCSVSPNQTVNIVDSSANLISTVTVVNDANLTPSSFDFSNATPPVSSSYYNGTIFLTSLNVQNIIIPGGYSDAALDGSTTGTTHTYSDFIATGVTPAFIPTGTALTATTNPVTENQSDLLTATISVPSASLSLIPATGAGSQAGGSVTFSAAGVTTPICSQVSVNPASTPGTYTATCSYETPSSSGPVSLSAVYSGDPYYQPSSGMLPLTVNAGTYLLYVTAGPGGTVTASNGQQPAGSTPTISASPNAGYYFSGWMGSTDIANPSSATTTVTMNGPENIVANFTAKTTPTITWTPASIELGYPLGAAQLNATANPSGGTFVYNPLSGTLITNPTGQTLSVTYTPADTTHYNVAMKTVPLTVTAGPEATLSTSSINFGTLYLGSIVTKTVTVTDSGTAAMTISDPRIAIVPGVNGNLSEFITVNLCPKSLAVGKSCTMTVTFIAGPFYNTQNATLSIVDSAYSSPQTVMLTATVINPVPQFSATSLSFGTEKVGKATTAKTITVTSVGGTALSITKVALAGADPGDYSETNNCITTLNPKANCTISVTFKPTKTGSRPATLVITDNAFNSSQSLLLSGTGD